MGRDRGEVKYNSLERFYSMIFFAAGKKNERWSNIGTCSLTCSRLSADDNIFMWSGIISLFYRQSFTTMHCGVSEELTSWASSRPRSWSRRSNGNREGRIIAWIVGPNGLEEATRLESCWNTVRIRAHDILNIHSTWATDIASRISGRLPRAFSPTNTKYSQTQSMT